MSADKKVKFLGSLWPEEIITPDFEMLKKKTEGWTIKNCIEVLTGIQIFEWTELLFKRTLTDHEEQIYSTYIESVCLFEKDFIDDPNQMDSWEEEFYEYRDKVIPIYEGIRFAIEVGDIKAILNDFEDSETIELGDSYIVDPLSFVKWAMDKGYEVPKKLLVKEENGQLIWDDCFNYENWVESFPKHLTGKTQNEDPLYMAIMARQAYIDYTIDHLPKKGLPSRVQKWVKNKFGRKTYLSNRKLRHIASLATDGKNQGGKH